MVREVLRSHVIEEPNYLQEVEMMPGVPNPDDESIY